MSIAFIRQFVYLKLRIYTYLCAGSTSSELSKVQVTKIKERHELGFDLLFCGQYSQTSEPVTVKCLQIWAYICLEHSCFLFTSYNLSSLNVSVALILDQSSRISSVIEREERLKDFREYQKTDQILVHPHIETSQSNQATLSFNRLRKRVFVFLDPWPSALIFGP